MNTEENDDPYQIETISEEDIYRILDVPKNITKNALEQHIITKINEYQTIDRPLYEAFLRIYNRLILTPKTKTTTIKTKTIKEGFATSVTPSLNSGYNPALKPTEQVERVAPQQVASIQQIIDYKSDVLNPILKETITKTITINSFNRDVKSAISTDFTLTLSETLNNVVSLKLYSVQIPYTWYTINTNVGSNYFVLQGNSAGINNSANNIFIDISSGNYTPNTLVTAIQNSLTKAKAYYSDISFGNTSITYNDSTALTSFNFDIQNRFNETDYYFAFPSDGWTNPNTDPTQSLAGFLGFNYLNYYPFALLSNQTQLALSADTATQDNTLSIYNLTAQNNTISVVQYVPTTAGGTYQGSQTVQTVDISFSLPINNNYTRTQLFQNFATQLINNPYIDPAVSEFTRVDVDNAEYINYGFSYFQFLIKLNRRTTQTIENQKCALIFPDESTARTPIWIGPSSCFHFDISTNELNNIYSETPSNIDTFTLTTLPYIAFTCQKAGYDVSTNNFYLPIDTLPFNTPITFTQYQTAINTAFATAQSNSVTNFNPNGDFNLSSTSIQLNGNSIAQFSIDINKNITEDKYFMDISNANNFLFTTLDISLASPIDLSNTQVFTSTIPLTGGGYFPTGQIATFYLKPAYQGTTTPPPVVLNSNGTTYQSIAELQTGINNLFATYQNVDNQNVLSGSTLSLIINNNQTVSVQLIIQIDTIISQSDFNMVITDASHNNYINVLDYTETSNPTYNTTTWYEDLFFQDISFNNGFIPLSIFDNQTLSSAILTAQTPVGNSTFVPIGPQYKTFYIVPQSSGITDPDNINVIEYTLTENSYTKNQVIQEINTFFNTNAFTRGSTISLIEQGGKETTQIRLNIDKTFRAYDYNLVFYSPYNIPACSNDKTVNNNNVTTWDTCLGWVLGFKQQTEYTLSQYWNFQTNTAQLTGDSVLSVFIYSSFNIVLDDYTHNHLNDALITINQRTPNYQNNTIPTTYQSFNQQAVSTKQNYGLNQELNAQTPAQNLYSQGVYLKDVFGIIPMDVSTLNNNDIFVQIASTLQDQKRIYFGPVNIYRMRIALYTDRGQIVNINGADWSFQMLVEQLYTPTK